MPGSVENIIFLHPSAATRGRIIRPTFLTLLPGPSSSARPGCRASGDPDTMPYGSYFVTNRQRSPRLKVVKSAHTADLASPALDAAGEVLPPPAMHIVEHSAEVRAAKVAALKAAIATGAYEVDPDQVAREILRHGL